MIRENHGLLIPAIAGVLVSLLVSDNKGIRSILARAGTGIFCALVFTDAVIHWMGHDPEIYRKPVSGLLAMTGFELVRWCSTLNAAAIIDLVKDMRGRK